MLASSSEPIEYCLLQAVLEQHDMRHGPTDIPSGITNYRPPLIALDNSSEKGSSCLWSVKVRHLWQKRMVNTKTTGIWE